MCVPDVSAHATTSPAKRRRVSMARPPQTLAFAIRSEGARAHPRVAIFQERLLPRVGSHTGPRVLWQRAWLLILPRGDRRKIGIAVDGFLPHVLPAIEQEYRECERHKGAEDGAKGPDRCPVVVHHHSDYLNVRPTPMPVPGSCGGAGGNCGSLVACRRSL